MVWNWYGIGIPYQTIGMEQPLVWNDYRYGMTIGMELVGMELMGMELVWNCHWYGMTITME